MGNEKLIYYKLPKRIIMFASAIYLQFFILGVILDNIREPELAIYPDLLLNLALAVLFVMPLIYLLLTFFASQNIKSFKKAKINWARWEKLGRTKFIAFRIFYYVVLGILMSIAVFLISIYILKWDSPLSAITFATYLAFAIALISSVIQWDMHELTKDDSNYSRTSNLSLGGIDE